MIAADLRRRRPKPHSTWHLDEVFIKIDGRFGLPYGVPSMPRAIRKYQESDVSTDADNQMREVRWAIETAIVFLLGWPPASRSSRLVQCEPELRDKRGAAPAGGETFRISHRVDASAGCGVGIAGEDVAVLLGEIGVVVAQVEI